MKPVPLIVSCEHGGNRIPEAYAERFRSAHARRVLGSHRGYDIGALAVARGLARRFGAPLFYSTVSRLVVDLNRSEDHRELISDFMQGLSHIERETILKRHYRPHRNRVFSAASRMVEVSGYVVHVAVHSFTPRLDGQVRAVDVGLLYDPKCDAERDLCRRWRVALLEGRPDLRVRMNQPYKGVADCLPRSLRRDVPSGAYLGIELEMSQKLVPVGAANRRRFTHLLGTSLHAALGQGRF